MKKHYLAKNLYEVVCKLIDIVDNIDSDNDYRLYKDCELYQIICDMRDGGVSALEYINNPKPKPKMTVY